MRRSLARFSCVVSIVALLPTVAHSATLKGSVHGPDGEPIASARVGIATAAPLMGPAMFCPSCYLDCAKSAKTDAAGRFEIANVSDSLKFQLLFTATDHKSQITKLVDPAAGDVDVKLELAPKNDHPERTIRIQVVDDKGNPIEGALVEPCGAKTRTRQWGGGVKEVESTVSDAEGRFALILPEDFQTLDIEITTNGKAGLKQKEIAPGGDEQKIVVPTGARVTGRVVAAGVPITGFNIAVCQLDRGLDRIFKKAIACKTDEAGRFDFNYLPPNQRYCIYTLAGEGASESRSQVLSTKNFSVLDNGQPRDLGTLEVSPSIHVRGRVEIPEGMTLPAAAKLMFNRDPAWDLIAVPIAEDGTFETDGLSPEVYEIAVNTKNFDIDGSRVDFQMRGPKAIGIYATNSIDDLRIPLLGKTPEAPPTPSANGASSQKTASADSVRNEESHRGANSGVRLTGRVLKDGKPLAGVKMKLNKYVPVGIDGARSEATSEATTDEDGRYAVAGLVPGDSYSFEVIASNGLTDPDWQHQSPWAPKVREGAHGDVHLPDVNLLSTGQSFRGIVVDPAGKPVEGITIGCMLDNGMGLSRSRDGKQPWMTTAADGRFEFTDLPEKRLGLMAYKSNPQGGSIHNSSRFNPKPNQQDIRIVYDPTLDTEPEDLDALRK